MEPRLKSDQIILAAEMKQNYFSDENIFFHFSPGSMLKWNTKILLIILLLANVQFAICYRPSVCLSSVCRL